MAQGMVWYGGVGCGVWMKMYTQGGAVACTYVYLLWAMHVDEFRHKIHLDLFFLQAVYILSKHQCIISTQEYYMENRQLRIADKVHYRDAPFLQHNPALVEAVEVQAMDFIMQHSNDVAHTTQAAA